MKMSLRLVRTVTISLCLLLLAGVSLAQGGHSLMIQSSPVNGGMISPAMPQSGVLTAQMNERMVVTAVPNPGFRFVYWLGDVEDITANSTSVTVDGPKILVAVFEREDNQESVLAGSSTPNGPGYGGARSSYNGVQAGGPSNSGAGSPSRPSITFPPSVTPPNTPPVNPPTPPNTPSNETIGPGDPNPNDPPVPEPASIMLMGLGGLMLRKMRRK